MKIGVPRETKEGERRVGLQPAAIAALTAAGHALHVESQAGAAVGHDDAAYARAGAIVGASADAWKCELIVKVKEVQRAEFASLAGQSIFAFQQLVGEPARTRALAAAGVTALAFELVREPSGGFPLLAPMSVISGRMSIEVATRHLRRRPARVLVLGAGNAGLAAAQAALQAGAEVIVLTRSQRSVEAAQAHLGPNARTGLAVPDAVEEAALRADLVVGAALVPGEPTPKLLPRALVKRMSRGAMIVDISIDGGGVAETSRPTTHESPVFVDEGVIHYAVQNMPAADPRASAAALSAAALPYALELANRGIAGAVRGNPALRASVLLWKGRPVHRGVADEAGLAYTPLSDADLA